MMIRIAAALAMAMAALPASAQTWHLIGAVGEKPDRFARWIEAESIQREGATVRFRVQEVREGPSELGYDGLLITFRVDCDTRGYETLQLVAHMADGQSRTIQGDGRASPPPPVQSVVGRTIEMGCGRHPLGDAERDPATASRGFWDD
jgi:hypothetical protein